MRSVSRLIDVSRGCMRRPTMSDLAQWDVRGPVRSQLPAALLPCAANACAILDAIERVPAREMFDVTATTSPRPGKVMNEVDPPTGVRLECPAIRVGSPASATVSSIQPRPYSVSLSEASRCDRCSFLTVDGSSSLPRSSAIPNRTRSDAVERNPPAPAKHE